MEKREIQWNVVSIPEEERNQYFFMILNDSRETSKIKSRIIQMLAPVEDFQERRGRVNGNHYDLISFYSRRGFENGQKRKIYQGAWKRDERLYERARDGIRGLEDYVVLKLSKD